MLSTETVDNSVINLYKTTLTLTDSSISRKSLQNEHMQIFVFFQ